jgi:tetratricopeptide (TPR) repeat protein
VAYLQSEFEQAGALHEESLALSRALGDKWGIGWNLLDLGQIACLQGRYGEAKTLYEESLSLFRELGAKTKACLPLAYLGLLVHRQANDERAATLLREGLALARDQGSHWGRAECLEGLAALRVAPGRWQQAAMLFGAAAAQREALGTPLPMPLHAFYYDQTLTILRGSLGEEAFAAAWAEGRALPLDEAIALALEDSSEGSPPA